jgi:hypothetical protein
MLKKIFDNITWVNGICIALSSLITAALSVWATMQFSNDKLEARVVSLEKYVAESGPPATFWEKQCARLIEDFAGAHDPFQESRIDKAMQKAGCRPD